MAFCGKCGTSMADGVAFCPKCGAPAGPVVTGMPAQVSGPAVTPAASGLAENVAGLLCYALGWLTGLIFLLIDKRPFVRFHAAQSIVDFRSSDHPPHHSHLLFPRRLQLRPVLAMVDDFPAGDPGVLRRLDPAHGHGLPGQVVRGADRCRTCEEHRGESEDLIRGASGSGPARLCWDRSARMGPAQHCDQGREDGPTAR
jgi:hypothetical protein